MYCKAHGCNPPENYSFFWVNSLCSICLWATTRRKKYVCQGCKWTRAKSKVVKLQFVLVEVHKPFWWSCFVNSSYISNSLRSLSPILFLLRWFESPLVDLKPEPIKANWIIWSLGWQKKKLWKGSGWEGLSSYHAKIRFSCLCLDRRWWNFYQFNHILPPNGVHWTSYGWVWLFL